MYQYTDNNKEINVGIEPEYSASYCEDKREITCFYNGITQESFGHVNTLADAQEIANLWHERMTIY